MLIVMFLSFLIAVSSSDLSAVADDHHGELRGRGRGLKSFKAAAAAAIEENTTTTTTTTTTPPLDCSPSGPCIPCLYHEKKLETYRCSETGYRIPIKCGRVLSSTTEVGSEVYITYRSCIPAVNQDKLSLLAFEAIMLLLLVSSSFVIFRRKGTLPGAIRVPTNPPRF